MVSLRVGQDERDVSRKALLEDMSRLEQKRQEAEDRASKLDSDASLARQELAQALNLAREAESERERWSLSRAAT